MTIKLRYNDLNGDFVRFGEGRGKFNGIIAVFPVVNGAHKKTSDGGKDREGDPMKKIIVLALVAMLLTGGLVLASCDAGCPGDGKCGSAVGKICAKAGQSKKEADKAVDCATDLSKQAASGKSTLKCSC